MKFHEISPNYFEDTYLLYYGAGCMGDFLGSLITYSFHKTFDKPISYHGPDSFFYEPWSKKWLLRDSSENGLRRFMMTKRNLPPVLDSFELAKLLPTITDSKKSLRIPFLFVSENLGIYAKAEHPAQNLSNISLISARFSNLEHKPLYFFLSLYKNSLHAKKLSHSDELEFANWAKQSIMSGNFFPIKDKIKNYKKYYNVDMLKLILDNDFQDLDMIDNSSETKNMINVARRDMIEILDFFDLDLDNLNNIDTDKLKIIYRRLQNLINN